MHGDWFWSRFGFGLRFRSFGTENSWYIVVLGCSWLTDRWFGLWDVDMMMDVWLEDWMPLCHFNSCKRIRKWRIRYIILERTIFREEWTVWKCEWMDGSMDWSMELNNTRITLFVTILFTNPIQLFGPWHAGIFAVWFLYEFMHIRLIRYTWLLSLLNVDGRKSKVLQNLSVSYSYRLTNRCYLHLSICINKGNEWLAIKNWICHSIFICMS